MAQGTAGLPAACRSVEVRLVVVLTQVEYDALPVKDPETLYLIVG